MIRASAAKYQARSAVKYQARSAVKLTEPA